MEENLVEFLKARISEWESGETLKWMRIGACYHRGDNDIKDRERYVLGRGGAKIVPDHISQSKLRHNFIRKLTRQKIGYLLAKPLHMSTDSPELTDLLQDYLTDDFYRVLKGVGQNSITAGIGWIQLYYDSDGVLRMKRIPPEEIIPFWEDIDHTVLKSSIRVFHTIEYDGSKKKDVKRAQVFTREGVHNFVWDSNTLIPDDPPWTPYFSLEGDLPHTWDRIPLIPIKYNDEELPLIYTVKDLIDDYDLNTSDLSNELQDEPNAPKVVRNYDGTNKEEFIHNLATLNVVFVRDDGEVNSLNSSINHSARDSHLDRLRKDIYELGGGVDTQNRALGNASGVALKFIYSDLDIDCTEFANGIRWSLRQLVWYILKDILIRTGTDYSDEEVNFEFNTDITINEDDKIANLKNSVGMISDRTIVEQHPYVRDSEEELRVMRDERTAVLGDLIPDNFKEDIDVQ
jgi:SPP1 family phage portal protein